VSQTFQLPDQGAAKATHIDAVKIICTEFPVILPAFEHVKGNHQYCMGHCHGRSLGAPPRGNAAIQNGECFSAFQPYP
jgi:hypothetical protein